MNEMQIAVAVLADAKSVYKVGNPLNESSSAIVERIILDGNNIEVFARTQANKCHRKSLVLPSVSMLVSLAPKSFLSTLMSQMDNGERITAVHTTDGQSWELNVKAPGEFPVTIAKIYQDDDMVQVVTIPDPGCDLDTAGLFLVFTLMPFSFLSLDAESPLDVWLSMQQQMLTPEEEEEEDEDDDDDSEDEEVASRPSSAPAAVLPSMMPNIPPPPPPVTNGAAQPNPTE